MAYNDLQAGIDTIKTAIDKVQPSVDSIKAIIDMSSEVFQSRPVQNHTHQQKQDGNADGHI